MENIYAEIITIGDEILYGQIVDTNSQWISKELDKIGIRTFRKTSIGDDRKEIVAALTEALSRSQIVLITGGLGPTKDDITKHTLAAYFDTPLKRNEEVFLALKNFYESRGRQLNDLNSTQADLPEACRVIRNMRGTASGMWFDHKGKVVISMPGVPHEMKGLMSGEILPSLQMKFDAPFIRHQMIRTIGIGESDLAPKIESWENNLPAHIKLAYLPRAGQVRLRLTGQGTHEDRLIRDLQRETEKVVSIIPEYVFEIGNHEINVTIARLLTEQGKTVATAESCTGGYLGHLLTEHAGSSKYFLGGFIPYSNKIKETQLRVPNDVLRKHGAVSQETVKVMAETVRKQFGSTYGLSTSGVAGPGGGTIEKPVGTIWIAMAGPEGVVTQLLQLNKDRKNNIYQTAQSVLELLRQELLKNK